MVMNWVIHHRGNLIYLGRGGSALYSYTLSTEKEATEDEAEEDEKHQQIKFRTKRPLFSLSHSQSVTRDTLIACLAGEGLTEGEGEVQIKGAAATTIEQIMNHHRGEKQSLKLQKEKL